MAGDERSARAASQQAVSRRELAVTHALEAARERAEDRVRAFLDAALELMNSESGQEFTLQDVIERSGQSLRSFYQHFNGKHELLLAVFEDAVSSAADRLRQEVSDEDDPIEQLHRFALGYYRLCQPAPPDPAVKPGFVPAFAGFAQRLLTEHPQEASRAFAPVAEILRELLERAARSGAIRFEFDDPRTAGVILQVIMLNAFAATISGVSLQPTDSDPAEQLWDLLLHGLVVR